METAEIKRIVQDQEKEKNDILKNEKIIVRDVDMPKLKGFIKYPNILTILGVRRCGKSILSWLLMNDKKYAYVNFDDESFYGIQTKDLNAILKVFYELYGDVENIILDEIQNIKGWELFANRLRRTKKVILTGSNSQLLAGELATHLTGRHIDFVLFPFSFKEFCNYKDIKIEDFKKLEYTTQFSAKMEGLMREYLAVGGFPESYKYKRDILKSIFSDIVNKDIIKRYKIKNVSILESLGKYLVSNFGNEMSFNKLKNIFSIKKVSTIKNYVRYFENAYLIFVIERFSYKLKEQIIAPKKVYCIDVGIINSIAFMPKENLGKLCENIVCIELLRRKNYFNETEIFYWKNAQQEEVDFIIKENTKVRQLIQVCYDISNINTKEREVKSLLKASKELRCNNLLVITWDYEAEEKIKGKKINFLPLWKWLLN